MELEDKSINEEVWVDECDGEEEGLADVLMDDNTIASVARPGTSLRTAHRLLLVAIVDHLKPSGRPLSGVVRPGSQGGRPGTMDQALRTQGQPRQLVLSLRIWLCIGFGSSSHTSTRFKDWWWKVQLGRCYYRLGLFRDAEKQFKSALQQQDNINTFLLLGRVYIRLDQPMAALEIYKSGLDKFPGEVTLLTAIARIYEGLHDLTKAVKFYKDVLHYDATHVEAIACIGTNHFYTDQPEVALRFYRRLLQMGIYNCEIFNNLGLCCFYAQQYDMTLTCFERALSLATDESVADVWALAISTWHTSATACSSANNDHGESYNNLGVLEYRRGNYDTARAFFMTSATLAPHMFQPHFNHSKLAHKTGDLQTSYIIVQKALQVFPAHVDSKELLSTLETHFHTL
ncbi:hypothetical protein C7M84_020428 [Penaeus vannamei]|uniref:Tetratricopeptide repeat protein 8 n=1 Tax=Penaeus vannamei TaxID=6689 RepID=A0A3R7QAJ0_PENVA|nr:hypothetical protein C7M84_020428 [Penaeus vannamei]